MNPLFAAAALAVMVEAPVVALLFPDKRIRMAVTCAIATTVTNVAMHVWLPRLTSSPVIVGEIAATAIEAACYAAVSRDPGRALVASGLANAASYVAGFLFW